MDTDLALDLAEARAVLDLTSAVSGLNALEHVDAPIDTSAVFDNLDSDLDGISHAEDEDDDNDGLLDVDDDAPLVRDFVVANQTVDLVEDTQIAVDVSAINPVVADTRILVVSDDMDGDIEASYPTVTFTPDANFFGTTSVTLRLTDGVLTSPSFEITFNVSADDGPLTGFAQKGPFVTDASVTARTLDDDGSIGDVVETTAILSDSGAFSFELDPDNTYLIEVEGAYFDELTGAVSQTPATLQPIATRTSSGNSVNVNLMTHAVSLRALVLAGNGMSLGQAHLQAQTELDTFLATLGVSLDGAQAEQLDLYDPENGGKLLVATTLLMTAAAGREETIGQLAARVESGLGTEDSELTSDLAALTGTVDFATPINHLNSLAHVGTPIDTYSALGNVDTDLDGIRNDEDPDDDNDGIADSEDVAPFVRDILVAGQVVELMEDGHVTIDVSALNRLISDGAILVDSDGLSGSVAVDYPMLTFTPTANFSGETSVTLRLTDGHVTSPEFGVTFNVASDDGTLTGIAQKGSFDAGSLVTLWPLSADGNVGEAVGTTTTLAGGAFSIDVEPGMYVIEVTGTFFDELSGTSSTADIALVSLNSVPTEGATANVNIVTHLITERALDLSSGPMSVAAAQTQAQAEVEALLADLGVDIDGQEPESLDVFDPQNGGLLIAASALLLATAEHRETSIGQLTDQVVTNFDTTNPELTSDLSALVGTIDLADVIENLNGQEHVTTPINANGALLDLDTDLDGVPNGEDSDDDNDGIPDSEDAAPLVREIRVSSISVALLEDSEAEISIAAENSVREGIEVIVERGSVGGNYLG